MTAFVPIRLPENPGLSPEQKEASLLARLADAGSVIVALSGGADSAYLAWVAQRALGERALSITALSPSFSAHDRGAVDEFVRTFKIHHEFVDTHEIENPAYRANAADRCFYCKDELFSVLDALAQQRGFSATAYGVNADDTLDFRPGHRAAKAHRVLAPLLDADRKSTRLNSSHPSSSYAVFCLKKKTHPHSFRPLRDPSQSASSPPWSTPHQRTPRSSAHAPRPRCAHPPVRAAQSPRHGRGWAR